MKVKCDYCDNYIDETEEQCPYCGAPNAHMTRSGSGVPKTIDELLAFAEARNIPLEKMRFYIGKDYREPKAFGIYQDDEGNFVVYKNKANGQRAVRYRGNDEAYAVNEIYQKMRAEVLERKQAAGKSRRSRSTTTDSFFGLNRTMLIVIALVIAIGAGFVAGAVATRNNKRGYYNYNDTYYYYDNGWWIDTDSGWESTSYIPDELEDNYETYYEGHDYDDVSGQGVTEYVSDTSDDNWWSNDWDDDDWSSSDDWDWDDWSSSDTDWDSDW